MKLARVHLQKHLIGEGQNRSKFIFLHNIWELSLTASLFLIWMHLQAEVKEARIYDKVLLPNP